MKFTGALSTLAVVLPFLVLQVSAAPGVSLARANGVSCFSLIATVLTDVRPDCREVVSLDLDHRQSPCRSLCRSDLRPYSCSRQHQPE